MTQRSYDLRKKRLKCELIFFCFEESNCYQNILDLALRHPQCFDRIYLPMISRKLWIANACNLRIFTILCMNQVHKMRIICFTPSIRAIRSQPCLEHDPRWYQSYITKTYRYENHVSDKQSIESLKLTDKLSMKNQPEKYSTKPC